MNEFGSIEDDYIQPKEKATPIVSSYIAHSCNPRWFFDESTDVQPDEKVIKLKFKADYLYFSKEYKEALDYYLQYMEMCPNLNSTFKRECLECIARCYLKLCSCIALKYANLAIELSNNFDQYTNDLNLLLDICLSRLLYEDGILHCQKLLLLHPTNYDIWLKLARCYAGLYAIPSQSFHWGSENFEGSIECKSEQFNSRCVCKNNNKDLRNLDIKNQKGKHFVIVSFLYVEFLLHSTLNSSISLALKRNLRLMEKIKEEFHNFAIAESLLNHIKEQISNKFSNLKSNDDLSDEKLQKVSLKVSSNDQIDEIFKKTTRAEFEQVWLFTNLTLLGISK